MSNVNDLEKQLEKARKEEKEKALQQNMKSMKKNIGMGHASHSLNTYMNTKKKAFDFRMFYIHDVVMKYNEPRYVIETIEVVKTDDNYRVSIEESDYFTSIPYDLGAKRYPITADHIAHFKNTLVPILEKSIDQLRYDYKPGKLISQGDYSKERNSYNLLLKQGHTFFKLDTEHHRILELLVWNNHPYIFNEFLLKTDESLEIVREIALDLYNKAMSWGGSIRGRDMPRYTALIDFYNKYKGTIK